MKKALIILSSFLLLIPGKVLALADNAKSSILIDYASGTIIYENKSDDELPMASMTKMMTLLLVMERLESGKVSLQDDVFISENAASMGGSQVYLEAGQTMKLDILLKAVCIASANDAAVALAEHVAGSTEEFVRLMNLKKDELHLKHTNFMNVHGLDDKNHYSSAHDMAFIARELLRHELILNYSSIYEDYIKHPNGASTWIVNTNKLINYYKGLDGLKTGYTTTSGYCITATAKRNNLRLISVVMGEKNNNIRNQDTIELLNYGFTNYKLHTIVSHDDDLGYAKVLFGKKAKVKLKLENDAVDLVNILEENSYSYEIESYEITAPIKVGDKAGKLHIYANDKLIKSYDLTVEHDVKKANIFDFYLRNLNHLIAGYH